LLPLCQAAEAATVLYSLNEYGRMIADSVRMDPYALALKRTIGPSSIVLDIGAATGIHSLLAAKFGAKKIYAVEPNEAVHLARQLASANGFEDRIEFIQDVTSNITLPEPATVIVSDLRGVLPLFGQHIPSLIDARQRLMASDGVLIPCRDILSLAIVESSYAYNELVMPWDYPYGLKMEAAKALVLSSWSSDLTDDFTTGSLLTEPQIWTILDYASIEDPDIAVESIVSKAVRQGTAHGILIWFDAELVEGIGFANGPGVSRAAEVYGRGFFPFLEPIPLEEGDTIVCDLSAILMGEEYVWRWHAKIYSGHDRGLLKADFDQSSTKMQSLYSGLSSKEAFKLKPRLGINGQIDRYILEQMNGRTTIASIAQRILTHYPKSFQNEDEACRYVHELFLSYLE